MRKQITILFMLFLSVYNFAQSPQVSIPITINDGATGSQVLYFGLDATATDGIDASLGEAVLPPLPPTGVFDARLNLPNGTESSLKDYRSGSNSFSGAKEYKLQYQVGTGTVINVLWNFMPGVTGVLKDLFGGVIVNQSMSGSGSYQVANPALNQLIMTITYTPPTLSTPTNGAENISLTPTFTWNSQTNATKYGLYIASDINFSNIVFSDTIITQTTKALSTALDAFTTYYWRVIGISANGRALYSETRNFKTVRSIGWANLQWPNSTVISQGENMNAYARIWVDGVTQGAGAGSNISAWIGYSTSNTNPNTWTDWVPATYNTDAGNNDEYMASIGATLTPGTYYFASRFQYYGGPYSYGGFNSGGGGFWDGTINVSGVLTVQIPIPGVPNLLSPANSATNIDLLPTLVWNSSSNATLYRLQIATDAGFTAIVFNDSTITDTSYTLTNSLEYNKQYFWRVKGKNATGSSNFSTSRSFTTKLGIGWVNLQFPATAEIIVGGSATFYARVFASGITEASGQGAGISGWIGYSSTNTNPNTWTNWVPATYNTDQGNNDEYQAVLGSTLPAGTYYVASRFLYGIAEFDPGYKYGGYSTDGGSIWNGTTNVSSVLTISQQSVPIAPTLVAPLNNATGLSTLPTLTWNASANATSYRVIIATDAGFTNQIFNDSTITTTSKTLSEALQNNKKYYWKVNAKNVSGTSGYSTTWNFTTVAVIGWANLQFPGNAVIGVGGSATFYSRVFAQNITEPSGQGAGISAWIGYSTANTNPNTWTNWVPATYNTDQGNNDEYQAAIGSTFPSGTYYVASRFLLGVTETPLNYVYGGYNTDGGGIWNGTNYASATLSVAVPAPGAPTLVSPSNSATGLSVLPTLTWNSSANAISYRLIIATDNLFSNVVFNDSTITDTSKTLASAIQNNKTYYWKVSAKNSSGTSSYSTVWSFTTIANIGWANLQFPGSAAIDVGGSATFYSRVYAQNITEPTGQGAGVTAWIGYSTTNTNPNTWTNWMPATYNSDQGNNDEYQAALGSTLPAGNYYVASRFQLGATDTPPNYVYGGYSAGGGGFWNGTNYVSSVLTIAIGLPSTPILAAPLNDSYNQPVSLQFKWNKVLNAASYRLQVAADQNFNNIVYNDSTITDTTVTVSSGLLYNSTYYWRVKAKNTSGTSSNSDVWNFQTVPEVPLLTNLWQFNSGNGNLPTWFSTNNLERGIAFGSINPALESDDRLYVASRNGGIFIRILNALNGVELGTLNNSGITGGDLPINDVETSSDGKIFVCNMTENASVTPFKVYLWSNESAAPAIVINWLSTEAVKLGDKFTVTGSCSDNTAVIYAASETSGINKIYKWTMSNGIFNASPIVVNLGDNEPGVKSSASVGPLPNGDFYWKASLFRLKKYTPTGSLIDTISTSVVPLQSNAVRYIGKTGNKEYAVVFQYGSINENARVIEVTDNNYAQALRFGTTPTLGSNPNTEGFGDVAVKINPNGSADIFILSTNNGIGKYQTIQPVPVELTNFVASLSGDNVQLNWCTATESNSKEFVVERTEASMENWKAIYTVQSIGNSVIPQEYSYTDQHLKSGKYEYRLKLVDLDGTYSYSQSINIETENPASFLLLQNYPNPFNPSTSISYQLSENSRVKLAVFDVVGNEIAVLVDKQEEAGFHTVTFDANNLTSGIYFYELRAGEFLSVKKFVLMK